MPADRRSVGGGGALKNTCLVGSFPTGSGELAIRLESRCERCPGPVRRFVFNTDDASNEAVCVTNRQICRRSPQSCLSDSAAV